jgi:NADH-quinone oxidoreductase subunit E
MNQLKERYPEEVAQILSKYPAGRERSAVMPLLYLAQREAGYVTKQSIADIAELCGVSTTEVASLIGFYTLYRDEPNGRYRVQVCTDLPCALRGADEFLAKLCANLGVRVGEPTSDGMIVIEEVKCLAGCDHAPVFQVQDGEGIHYRENQTVESALEVIEALRARAKEADQ